VSANVAKIKELSPVVAGFAPALNFFIMVKEFA